MKILHQIGKAEEMALSSLQSLVTIDKVTTRYDVDELARIGLVRQAHEEDGDPVYAITHPGREVLVKHGGKQIVDSDGDRIRFFWEFDHDRMRFEAGDERRQFFITREALEDDLGEPDLESPTAIFEKNWKKIRNIAVLMHSDGAFEGQKEFVIKSGDVTSFLDRL